MNGIFDACSLINCVNGEVLDLMLGLPDIQWSLGSFVHEETTRTEGCSAAITQALSSGLLTLLEDAPFSATEMVDALQEHGLGEGETECLLYAQASADMLVVCDDRAARALLKGIIGPMRVTGTLGLLRIAVGLKVLTVADALGAYGRMKAAGAFLPQIDKSFFSAADGPAAGLKDVGIADERTLE